MKTGRTGRWFSGLQARLTVVMITVTILATVSTLGINYWSYRRILLEQGQRAFVTDLQQRAGAVSADLASATDRSALFAAAERIGGDTVLVSGDVAVGLVSTLDDVPADLRATVSDRARGPATYFQRAQTGGQPILVVGIAPASMSQNSESAAAPLQIYAFKSLSTESQLLSRMVWTGILSAFGVLLVAAAVTVAATKRALRPLHRLDEAARTLANGTTVEPIAPSGNDEVARLTRTFNDSSARIDELVRDLRRRELDARRFAEDVSHELRTPLSAMVSVAEILDEQAPTLPDDLAFAVTTLAAESRRMATLVTDLLDISRPEATLNPAVAEPMPLGQALSRCIEIERYDAPIDVIDESDGAIVTLDIRRFHAIVSNLVSNAIRHGQTPIKVHMTRSGPDEVEIRIRDHGKGITPFALDKLFDRFFKDDAARGRSEGSGLGLSIVAKNVELHGGRVIARNADGGGAEFVVTLPLSNHAEES